MSARPCTHSPIMR